MSFVTAAAGNLNRAVFALQKQYDLPDAADVDPDYQGDVRNYSRIHVLEDDVIRTAYEVRPVLARLAASIDQISATLGNSVFAQQMGHRFNCDEVDDLCQVLADAGYDKAAAVLLHGHAFGDAESDTHHWEGDDDAVRKQAEAHVMYLADLGTDKGRNEYYAAKAAA